MFHYINHESKSMDRYTVVKNPSTFLSALQSYCSRLLVCLLSRTIAERPYHDCIKEINSDGKKANSHFCTNFDNF